MNRLTLIVVACVLQGALSYVFSCEEVKTKLMNSNEAYTTTSACVFLQQGLSASEDYLSTVYIQGQKDKTSYTLASIAATDSGCIKGGGPWQVISDDPTALDCYREFTLIFSSDDSTSYAVANADVNRASPGANRITFVSPSAGMRITVNVSGGDLNLYTGAGKDETENIYLIKRWSTNVPFVISTFDSVLTLETSVSDPTLYVTTFVNTGTGILSDNSVALVSSGKSNNLRSKYTKDNYVIYSLGQDCTATIKGTLSQDINYKGYLNISVNGDYMNEERTFREESIDWVVYGETVEVKYLTTVNADNVFENQDTFLVEIGASPLPTDITPIPTSVSTMAPSPPASDDYCNCRIVDDWYDNWDASDIWVDLIVIIDTSSSMGKSMDEATALISSFVGELTTDLNAPFYSRIGVIAVSQTADVIYNLNMTNTDDLNLKQSGVPKIDVGAAFQAALKMFADGESLPGYREKAKQIVYYLTNSAPGSNMNGVDDFKTNGGTIIVNDFVLEDETPNPDLKKLASNNFFFTDLSENYVNSLALFCEVNCFCDADAHPFNDDLISPRTQANRGCFHPVDSGIPQARARDTCKKEGGDLPSIHDAQKEFFVNSVISEFGNKKKFWLGIESVNDIWSWYDQSTDPFTDWDANQPNTNGGKLNCAYAVQTTGLNVKWTAANCAMGGILYVCESAPCSRGNDKCE